MCASSHSGRRMQRGVSLVEIMVGMIVALLIGLAATGSASVFTASQRQGIGAGGISVNASTALAALKGEAASAGLGFFGDAKFLCYTLDLSVGNSVKFDAASFSPVLITADGSNSKLDLIYASSVDSGANVLIKGSSNGSSTMLASLLPASTGQTVLMSPGTPASSKPCLVRSVTAVTNANGAAASLQAARSAAEIARKSLRDCELRAPLTGLVSQRLVQAGERVALDTKIVEIVDLSRIELEAAVAPEDVVAVRVGQGATLQVDGLATPVPARVARINPSTQAGTRAVMVYLQVLPGPAAAGLRQGLFAQGRIELDRKTALVVPASTLRFDQARPYVLAVAGGKAALRPVTPGTRGEVDFDGRREAAVELAAGSVSDGDVLLRGTVGALREGTALTLPR